MLKIYNQILDALPLKINRPARIIEYTRKYFNMIDRTNNKKLFEGKKQIDTNLEEENFKNGNRNNRTTINILG